MASLIETYGWHEWLSKTNFSFLLGASSPQDMISTARQHGYRSLCVSDWDGVYGLARCYRELVHSGRTQATQQAPLKLHYAAELHFSRDQHLPVLLQDTLVLVAKNWTGYHKLCELISYAHRDGKKQPYLPLEHLLASDLRGLCAIQPLRGLSRRGPVPVERFAALKAALGGELYFAVSRQLHWAEDVWIADTIALAQKLGCACLLSQDAFFHSASSKDLSDLLHAIRTNKSLEAAGEHFFPNAERHLHPLPALEVRYKDLPIYASALAASRHLADSISFCFSELRYHYPSELLPPGYDSQTYLTELTWQGAGQRLGLQLSTKVRTQLERELALIAQLSFADYFLTVWDIVSWARGQGILCQGRGSAANSAVCFVLGITAVDPTRFELLFERFLSLERGDPPDIDVDFEHERREEVVQYIYRRYGRERAAMVANVITFRSKGALRAVAKALQVPAFLQEKAAKRTRNPLGRKQGCDTLIAQLRLEVEQDLELKGLVPAGLCWQAWAQLSAKLKGFPRHLGIHSGGFIVSDTPLNALVAQEPASMPGRSVVQWCKEDIEGLGFFKIDVLALGMLTAIRKCLSLVDECYGKHYDMATIPGEDLATYASIRRADTVGVFQIESRAQMSMLPRLRPRTFYDLVIQVAIIRPGPIQGQVIHPYLRRRAAAEAPSIPHPKLRPILARTLGVIIFQEQLMQVAMEVGDFTPGEADQLRKMTGVWNPKGLVRDLDPILAKLLRGMRRHGLPELFIRQMLGQMRGFADYGFPESHAVSFALLAYVSAYLKTHYPPAFFTALLNSQPMGFYAPHSLLQAARRSGVELLPVCVNASQWDCTLENFALRLGLRLVAGLRRSGAEALVTARGQAGGRFASFEALLRLGTLYRCDLTALAAAGAFSCFAYTRKEALWLAEGAPFSTFFPVQGEQGGPWSEQSAFEAMESDFAAFATTLGPHPCELLQAENWDYELSVKRITPAQKLTSLAAGQQVCIFGLVLVKQAPPSAKGMVFFTLEDSTGHINLVFTPQVYAASYQFFEGSAFICASGCLQKANEYSSVLVQKVYPRVEKKASVTVLPQQAAETAAKAARKLQWG